MASEKKPNGYLSNLLRTTSCIGEPSENVLAALKQNDYETFANVLAEVALIPDDAETPLAPGTYPLPDDHWINSPTPEVGDNGGGVGGGLTMLQLATANGQLEFVKLLLATGARAALFNERGDGSTALHIAVEKGNFGCVKLLLDGVVQRPRPNKADINGVDRNGRTALHVAAASALNRQDILKHLLENAQLEDVDAHDLLGGQTPLMVAAAHRNAAAAEALLAYGASLSARTGGKTARELLKVNMPYFDPDRVSLVADKRKVWNVADHLSYLLDMAARNAQKGVGNRSNLIQFSIFVERRTDPDEIRALDRATAGGAMSLMQKACTYGLDEHVAVMLDQGMDPNATAETCSAKPVLQAANYGFFKILRAFKKHRLTTKDPMKRVSFACLEHGSGESILTWILRRQNPNPDTPECDYERCLDILFADFDAAPVSYREEISKIINLKDSQHNTPLHYASQHWNQATVRLLLERGANIGIRNKWDETPIAMIMPETMEAFLNEHCLRWKNEVTQENFELEFNYSFLAPPVNSSVYDESDPEGRSLVEKAALPETESLWYMARSKNHRHLLNHPVIRSFLYLKWQRLRGYFNLNLRFYGLLVVTLAWYIFERFGGVSSRMTEIAAETNGTGAGGAEPGDDPALFCSDLASRTENGYGAWYFIFALQALVQAGLILKDWSRECVRCDGSRIGIHLCLIGWVELVTGAVIVGLLLFRTKLLWFSLTGLTVVFILRELLQLSASVKRYLVSPENWMEVAIITLIVLIAWVPDSAFNDPCETKRHMAAIVILLSWAEFITLVARHPRLARYNIYVTMFYKVLQTFLFFLLWYSFFIIAFGFGFYIMLHKDLPGRSPAEDEYSFFNYPWLTLVKTSTMFVGEIEFADIPIDIQGANAPVAYLFLLTFVFLIVVVLMNLLNGLAVSDTGLIREEAELVSAISSVETISYIESLLLGDPFNFLSNWPPFKWFKAMPALAICNCCFRSKTVRDISHKITGSTGILLFYSLLPDKTLKLTPNKRGISCWSASVMSASVISLAKSIIVKKEEERRRQKEAQLQAAKEVTMEMKMEGMARTVQDLEDKLTKILRALNV